MDNKHYTAAEINLLAARFGDSSLPKSEWTHEAHLLVGLWHLKLFAFSEAVCRLKSGIILLNRAHGTENTGTSGYHETLTVFWAKTAELYLCSAPERSLEEQASGFLASPMADRGWPFLFYEKKRLLSSELRAVYREADKALAFPE